ncbi:MAG: efflux RND transporter periplasmic adaptor subunit [Candidatus Binataceae bacterium]
MKQRELSRIAAVLALVVFSGCSPPAPAGVAQAKSAPAPVEVTIVKPTRHAVTRTITLTANVEAYEQVPLFAKVAGYVTTINVDIGDSVRKGELIATLEVPEIEQQSRMVLSEVAERQADLNKARADAELAMVIFARSKGLRAKDAITQQDMDEARAHRATANAGVEVADSRLRAAQAHLAEVRALLAYARITAPFDGIVTRRFVDPGALIQAATAGNNVTPVVTVARIDIMRVFVDVPEPNAPFISQGETAELRVEALPRHAFKGSVTRYAGALDPATRTMRTEVDLPNPDTTLRPGMYGNLVIVLKDRADALSLPRSVVHPDDRGAFIYVLRNGKAVERRVQLGLESNQRVEIVDGVSDGIPVISAPQELDDGTSVRIVAHGDGRELAGDK